MAYIFKIRKTCISTDEKKNIARKEIKWIHPYKEKPQIFLYLNRMH